VIVQDDGGDIDFVSFDEGSGVLTLLMKGSCVGCPTSSKTLRDGIERMVKYYVAEVEKV
jgi:Fe-S cluster biogenesis protein NfuA